MANRVREVGSGGLVAVCVGWFLLGRVRSGLGGAGGKWGVGGGYPLR